jgi:hypothetical protein
VAFSKIAKNKKKSPLKSTTYNAVNAVFAPANTQGAGGGKKPQDLLQ